MRKAVWTAAIHRRFRPARGNQIRDTLHAAEKSAAQAAQSRRFALLISPPLFHATFSVSSRRRFS
jgi:hypothetical protein